MQHTQGVWQWYWHKTQDEADCGVFAEKHEGQAYSICRSPRYQNKEQWKADASLISAAPELLALIIKARALIASNIASEDEIQAEWNIENKALLSRIDDIIKKASGKIENVNPRSTRMAKGTTIEDARATQPHSLAARFAACLFDYHDTCPECGNNRTRHMEGCNKTYEHEFKNPADTDRVFNLAFGIQEKE